MRDNTVPKRNWLFFLLVSFGVWNIALPARTQALLPYSPHLDTAQLEQQGIALTENVIQLVRFQQYGLALAHAKLATQLAPQKYQTWFILGTLFLQQNELDQALESLLKAQSMAPEEAGIKFTLGNVYFQKADYNAAIASLESGLKIKPETPSALFDLGNSFLKVAKWNDAIKSYEKAVSIEKDFWPAINNMGLVKYEQGDLDGALKKWQTAVSIDKEQAEPQLAIAVALYAQGQKEQGIIAGEKALKLDGRYGDIKFLKENLWGEKLIGDTQTFFSSPNIKSLLSRIDTSPATPKKDPKAND